MNTPQTVPCALTSVTYMWASSHSLLYSNFLFQEVELFEACYYGLMGQVHSLLTTGVNVNVALFVSGFCIYVLQYCAYNIVHSWAKITPLSVLLHACWVSHFICFICLRFMYRTWYISVSDYLYIIEDASLIMLAKFGCNSHVPKFNYVSLYIPPGIHFTHKQLHLFNCYIIDWILLKVPANT